VLAKRHDHWATRRFARTAFDPLDEAFVLAAVQQPQNGFMNRVTGLRIGWIDALCRSQPVSDFPRCQRTVSGSKQCQHQPRAFALPEPGIASGLSSWLDALGSQTGCEEPQRGIQMRQIRSPHVEFFLQTGDHAGNLSPLVPQGADDVHFPHGVPPLQGEPMVASALHTHDIQLVAAAT